MEMEFEELKGATSELSTERIMDIYRLNQSGGIEAFARQIALEMKRIAGAQAETAAPAADKSDCSHPLPLPMYGYADAGCWKCAKGRKPLRMILCPTCGNKRCPKASDHDLACTGSNEPGQAGSIY
jgi:hypothetical protein